MTADQLRFVASLFFGLLTVRTTGKVLNLRSSIAYACFYLANTILNSFMINNGAFDGFRIFFLNVIAAVVVPICLSTGPLKVRLTRIGLIVLCSLIAEVTCAAAYLLVAGTNARVANFSDASPGVVALVYAIGIPTMALCCEVVIAVCRKHDRASKATLDANLGSNLILFNLATYFLIASSMRRLGWRTIDNHALVVVFVFLTCICLSLVLSATALSVASREELVARDKADRTAGTRQVRHVKTEVASSAERQLEIQRLRHDLANQVDVVSELARGGHLGEADQYLALLQKQAQNLIGDAHE